MEEAVCRHRSWHRGQRCPISTAACVECVRCGKIAPDIPGPAKILSVLRRVPLPESNAQAALGRDCPPPTQLDARSADGKSPNDKEVSPPKRTKFSELHPYAIISLFDGVGSAIPAITKAVGGPPRLIIAAECDPILRQIVGEQFLFRTDGQWTKSCRSTFTIYTTDDVRNLLKEHCRILREAFSLAGPQCRWIVVAGSPCKCRRKIVDSPHAKADSQNCRYSGH